MRPAPLCRPLVAPVPGAVSGGLFLAVTTLLLSGCAEMPVGPSVAVMPGASKPFDVFMQDDQLCRSWASHAIGVPGHDAAAARMLASTIAGAAIGALAGAAVGDHRSAGAGAAMGTVVGASVGASQGGFTATNAQRRYDIAYQQCMYSKGNLVTGSPYGSHGWIPPPPPRPAP